MQTKLKRGEAASRISRARLTVATLASVPLILALATCVPSSAFAGCGVSSSTGTHAASSSASTGVHVSTGIATASGGGGTSSGCPTASSTSAVHALATAPSGRVVEGGAHAPRSENRVRTATTRTANTAHFHAFGAGHRV